MDSQQNTINLLKLKLPERIKKRETKILNLAAL